MPETATPPSPYWPQAFEKQICAAIPGYNLASLDDTDIETVFDYVAFLLDETAKEQGAYMVINGKRYKKVDSFGKG